MVYWAIFCGACANLHCDFRYNITHILICAFSILWKYLCTSPQIFLWFAGFIIIIVFLLLKYLGACDAENTVVETPVRQVSETEPLVPEKSIRFTYGTNEEDDGEGSSTCSSEDLYDAKLCVICYDDQRNCFFIPCGHCATCYDCAQRYISEKDFLFGM